MKKILPYILIIIVILIAGGIYIDRSSKHTSSIPGDEQSDIPSSGNAELSDQGKAPEFTGINKWLNSDPLTLEQLKGKVVLVDFWTYSCINCIRTLPYVTKWYDTYKDQGLVVIGVHTPEFDFEKVTSNVQTAIERYHIHYPVAQDNSYATWQAYDNRYWPAEYLINKDGHIVYTHFGEGKYDVTENAIRTLLGLDDTAKKDNGQDLTKVGSPEMYFGTDRLNNLTASQTPASRATSYKLPANSLSPNSFALEGTWKFDADKAVLTKAPGRIKLKFNSGKVHIVAAGIDPNKRTFIEVKVDGTIIQTIAIDDARLYTLFDSNDYKEHEMELYIDTGGFEAFTFTFG